MVTAKTCGRLGNFLFQFSAVYAHARKHGFDWCMPHKSMQERLWPTPKFKNIKYCSPQPGKLFQEKSPAYQEIPAEDNLILEGYWQSEKYMHGFKKEIAGVLEFERKETDYVAVHVRRGDYLQFPEQFPVLPIEYYLEAIFLMVRRGYKRFMFYSDDIQWCKKYFPVSETSEHVEFSTGKSAIDDMRNMYNAAAFIIANSSFSLFPALLRDDNPVVIAPADHRWFGPQAQNLMSVDRVPERFIKI